MINKIKNTRSGKFAILILSIILVLLGIFTLRLLSGEDNWICENGQWVKHGNPSAPMPEKECLRENQTLKDQGAVELIKNKAENISTNPKDYFNAAKSAVNSLPNSNPINITYLQRVVKFIEPFTNLSLTIGAKLCNMLRLPNSPNNCDQFKVDAQNTINRFLSY